MASSRFASARTSSGATYRNTGFLSTNFRMSQGQAIRSTFAFLRVIHFMPDTSRFLGFMAVLTPTGSSGFHQIHSSFGAVRSPPSCPRLNTPRGSRFPTPEVIDKVADRLRPILSGAEDRRGGGQKKRRGTPSAKRRAVRSPPPTQNTTPTPKVP